MFANDRSFSTASYADLLNLQQARVNWRKSQYRRRHDSDNAPITGARRTPDAGYSRQPAQPSALGGRNPATAQSPRAAPISSDRRRAIKKRLRGIDGTRDRRTADRSTSASDTVGVDGFHDDADDSHYGVVDDTHDLSSPAADGPIPALQRRSEHSPASSHIMLNTDTITVARDVRGSTTPGSAAGRAAQDSPPASIPEAARGRGTRGEGSRECYLCGRGLGHVRHACMDCSALICPSCVINAATFHPGHTLQPAAVRGGHEEPRPSPAVQQDGRRSQRKYKCFVCQQELRDERYKCQTCPDDLSLCKSCLDMHPEDHVFEVISCTHSGSTRPPREESHDHLPLFRCFICKQQLSDVRYECGTCSDNLNFCEAHREMHPEDHPLAAIKCAVRGSAQPDGSIGEGTGSASHADVRADELGSEHGRASTGEGAGGDPHPAEPRRRSARLGSQSAVVNRPRHEQHFHHDGSDDDEDHPAAQQLISKRHPGRLPSQVTVTFSRQRLLQFARTAYAKADLALALAQAADEAGPSGREIDYDGPGRDQHGEIGANGEHERPDGGDDEEYDLYKLLDFDLDFPLIGTPEQRRPARRRHHGGNEWSSTHQRWAPDEKQQLRALKRQGKSDAHIATVLGRTPGAVAQQWRKQCQ